MPNPLAGHTNSYHSYGFDEALAGIADAGFKHVELSAVPGWTEHVDLDDDPAEVRRRVAATASRRSASAATRTSRQRDGLEHGIRAVRWAAAYGLPIVNTAVGGHQSADENEAAFLANVAELADAAEDASWSWRSRSTATSWPRATSRSR